MKLRINVLNPLSHSAHPVTLTTRAQGQLRHSALHNVESIELELPDNVEIDMGAAPVAAPPPRRPLGIVATMPGVFGVLLGLALLLAGCPPPYPVANCEPYAARCVGTNIEWCSPQRRWRPIENCADRHPVALTCNNGACVGADGGAP